MAGNLERVLKGFEQSREFARTYRFEMTDDYRALIARVEAMPRNQSGADKSDASLGSHVDHQAFFDPIVPAPRK
jgi:hypothetical protein